MNVRLGKEGYWRREEAFDKAVKQKVEVHSGDVELGNGAEQQVKMAMKEVMPKVESIDVADILFFQATSLAIGSTASSSRATAQTALVLDPEADVAEAAEKSSGEESVGDGAVANPLQALSFALPKAKQQSLAKAKGQPKPKVTPSAKPAASSTAKGIKRKADETTKETTTAIIRLDQLRESSKKARGVEGTVDLADQAVVDDFSGKLQAKRSSLFASVADGDAGVAEGLKAAQKEMSALSQAVKQKQKSLKRRKDRESASFVFLSEKLEEILAESATVSELISGLIATSGEDMDRCDCLSKLKTLGWVINSSVWKRGFKCAMLSHLKYENWSLIAGPTRDRIIEALGQECGSTFFFIAVNDVIQRMIKSVLPAKAT